MKKIVFSAILLSLFAIAPGHSQVYFGSDVPQDAQYTENNKDIDKKTAKKKKWEKRKKRKKKRGLAKPFPGSQVIWLKNKQKAEIRPDDTVWWFGVNKKKALFADGEHVLLSGQKITTKDGKLVGKRPKKATHKKAKKPPVEKSSPAPQGRFPLF